MMQETAEPLRDQAQIFFQISKVDAAKREVSGVATAEKADKDGETLDYERSKPYFARWSEEIAKATYDPENPSRLSLGNVREMHDPRRAVGKLTALQFNDPKKQIEITAKIVDDQAWDKCFKGVLTGFSIGGRYIGGKPVPGTGSKYVAMPTEVSVVDNPCLPDAHFTYVKEDGSLELRKFASGDGTGGSASDSRGIGALSDDDIKKIADALFANLKKDHEDFRVTQGGPKETQLAGPGQGAMVDVSGQDRTTGADSGLAPREDDVFDPDDKLIEDISVGVWKDEDGDCPCEDCQAERVLKGEFDNRFGKGTFEAYEKAARCPKCNLLTGKASDKCPHCGAELGKAEQNYATHGGKKVPKGKHAWAPAGSSPSEWKYPVDTAGRARNALARWGQHKGIPKDEEPKVARRIIAAARRFGVEVDPKSKIAQDAKKSTEPERKAVLESQKVSATVEKTGGVPMSADLEKKKVKAKDIADDLAACNKAHDDYHTAFSGYMGKVLKMVEHGDDPSNRPEDIQPAAALESAGASPTADTRKPDQIPAGAQEAWKSEVAALKAEIGNLRTEIRDAVKEAAKEAAAEATKAVTAEFEKALGPGDGKKPEPKLGDRNDTTDKRTLVPGAESKLATILKNAMVGAETRTAAPASAAGESLTPEVRKGVEMGDPKTILGIMSAVKSSEVPEVVQKGLGLGRGR